jgi:hypothetical protein
MPGRAKARLHYVICMLHVFCSNAAVAPVARPCDDGQAAGCACRVRGTARWGCGLVPLLSRTQPPTPTVHRQLGGQRVQGQVSGQDEGPAAAPYVLGQEALARSKGGSCRPQCQGWEQTLKLCGPPSLPAPLPPPPQPVQHPDAARGAVCADAHRRAGVCQGHLRDVVGLIWRWGPNRRTPCSPHRSRLQDQGRGRCSTLNCKFWTAMRCIQKTGCCV